MSERTAVYRIFNADGALLYIGISKSFGRRWEQHASRQPWWSDVQRQTVDWYPDRPAAEAAEAAAIKAEHPQFNIVHTEDPRATLPLAERLAATPDLDPLLDAVARTGIAYQKVMERQPGWVAEHIAAVVAALRAGRRPTDVVSWSAYTDAHLRRLAREHGIPPARKGQPTGSV